ncbi:MAG TPA: DUF4037 domain-containing protein [Ktedonobacterales bacterium]|nr:DUF4037 domain-containing protein [Ktedonobacterales bacterium]
MPTFVHGLDLGERFYADAVRPILASAFPELAYSAALIGFGSDVLGYDTPQSTDHSWGPRLQLFLREDDMLLAPAISQTLAERLPPHILGYATSFGPTDNIDVILGVKTADGDDAAPNNGANLAVNHFVVITTLQEFFTAYLGVDPYEALRAVDWLVLSDQALLSVTAGRVFYDGLGELTPLRQRFAWYPDAVWRYLLSAQWMRIAQEEAFVGRCGDVGDDLGSRVVAARLARDVMRLCFLLERRYAPYSKWLGTAFARLPCAPRVAPALAVALAAPTWRERERGLCEAYVAVAVMQNALGMARLPPAILIRYHERPYLHIHAGHFASALYRSIEDAEVRALPIGVGDVDQWVDNTDALTTTDFRVRLRRAYQP